MEDRERFMEIAQKTSACSVHSILQAEVFYEKLCNLRKKSIRLCLEIYHILAL